MLDKIKRYSIEEHSYGDGNSTMEISKRKDGEFVYFEDVQKIFSNNTQQMQSKISQLISEHKEAAKMGSNDYLNLVNQLEKLSDIQ